LKAKTPAASQARTTRNNLAHRNRQAAVHISRRSNRVEWPQSNPWQISQDHGRAVAAVQIGPFMYSQHRHSSSISSKATSSRQNKVHAPLFISGAEGHPPPHHHTMITESQPGHTLRDLLAVILQTKHRSEVRHLALSWLRRELAACGDARTGVQLDEPVTEADCVRVCAVEAVA
jgi:hypothetical protein